MKDSETVVFNPQGKAIETLPVIYCFTKGYGPFGLSAVALSQDGWCLWWHVISSENFAPHDLGVFVGSRERPHEESYKKHYPGGYRMEFVSNVEAHAGLQAAFKMEADREG